MSSNACTGIPANPDVAGIGIRLSIYITTLIVSLVPNIERTNELRGALWTAAGLNGFALLITALIETANRSLTLYHAIVIIHMLTFLGVAIGPAGSYRTTPARLILYYLTTWMAFTLLLSWVVYVWTTAPTFGTPGTCNHATIYVVLFVSVRATIGWLRWFSVALAAIPLLLMACGPISLVVVVCGVYRPQGVFDERADDNPMAIVRSDEENPLDRWGETQARPPPPPRTFTGVSSASDGFSILRQLPFGSGAFGVWIASMVAMYGVIMLELTIQRNKKNIIGNENQWAFGQIVAMLITVGSLNEVLHFLLAELDRWRHG